jgi:hypothetical protein
MIKASVTDSKSSSVPSATRTTDSAMAEAISTAGRLSQANADFRCMLWHSSLCQQ